MCGSRSVFSRIHKAPEYGSNKDPVPDPQHWFDYSNKWLNTATNGWIQYKCLNTVQMFEYSYKSLNTNNKCFNTATNGWIQLVEYIYKWLNTATNVWIILKWLNTSTNGRIHLRIVENSYKWSNTAAVHTSAWIQLLMVEYRYTYK